MISALLVLNGKGHVLISRSFRSDIDTRAMSSAFRNRILLPKLVDKCPVKTIGNASLGWIKYDSMFLVGVSKKNMNCALLFQFLYKLSEVFASYFPMKKGVNMEEKLKENFTLVYELIDEVLDFGYPQNCEPDILKSYITLGGGVEFKSSKDMKKIMDGVTGAVSWRTPGIIKEKNEVYIDIIESVNVLLSDKNKVLSSNVTGKIVMNSFLSGMPECTFGLNDKLMMDSSANRKKKSSKGGVNKRYKPIDLDDITFHQCVALGRFDTERRISFIPPDGEFEVMSYRISNAIIPPFRLISPIVRELGKTRIEVQVTVRSSYNPRLVGKKVQLIIPLPSNTAKCKIRSGIGKGKYKPALGGIVWNIRRFPGASQYSLSADVQLTQMTSENQRWERPPISMKFQVPMYTASGLHVRFLHVHEKKMGYKAIKWVKYVTQSGTYEARLGK
mmetsp:Transcript_7347/g.10832  ORF Transcript_7347/g.10832 Transcript_7347/m.10832 type:complete len:445 (+) Transcript_7347:55-1389(+)